jgi:hypothetical protein
MTTSSSPRLTALAGLALLAAALSACTLPKGLGLPIQNGNYAPDFNLKGDQRRAYEQDLEACQKQIIAAYGDRQTSNNAITDLRQCLIHKGYVLLS